MENAEEILQCLDEFSKLKPKDIPRELEEYLSFVAKTGDPVYQWPLIKCLFREKLLSVITEFYESCPTVEIPPCPNVDTFNYDAMKSFILEKLDTFAAAPFTIQRICELLTSPRKEYNRVDKYMRALEKNILVVSTREPGNRKSTENGESIVNGLESEHATQEMINSDVNVEVEMDETAVWQKTEPTVPYVVNEPNTMLEPQPVAVTAAVDTVQDTHVSESKRSGGEVAVAVAACSSSIETVITSRPLNYIGYAPNISELMIEQSNTDRTFAMNTEPAAAESTQTLKEDELPYKGEQAEPGFVKQTNYMKAEYSDKVQLEPEPSVVQQTDPLVSNSSEPEAPAQSEPLDREPEPQPEPSSSPAEPKPSVEPCPSEGETQLQPLTNMEAEPSVPAQPEPEPSTAVQPEPESTLVYESPAKCEQSVTMSSETPMNETISSSDEQPTTSTAEQPAVLEAAVAEVSGTAEDQVSGSSPAAGECSEGPEAPLEDAAMPSAPEPDSEPVAAPAPAPAPVVESMQVDEPTTQVTDTLPTTETPQTDNN